MFQRNIDTEYDCPYATTDSGPILKYSPVSSQYDVDTEDSKSEEKTFAFTEELKECHSFTVVCAGFCICSFVTIVGMIILLLFMGGQSVEPMQLDPAFAEMDVTFTTKDQPITHPNDTQWRDAITDSFNHAAHAKFDNSSLNVQFDHIKDVFGHHHHRYHVNMKAELPSDLLMDNVTDSMLTNPNKNTSEEDVELYDVDYSNEFLNTFQAELQNRTGETVNIWNVHHVFDYPIVCSVELKIGSLTRGSIITGIKYSHNKMVKMTDAFRHEDVEPQQLFYADDVLGCSFQVKSSLSHNQILCDITEKATKYMKNDLEASRDNVLLWLNAFSGAVNFDTVRCCIAADGNINHELPHSQCVGYKGSRQCSAH